jgi:hypothetical protein
MEPSMTLSSGTNRQQHVGNGSTKAFAFSYQYRAAADLRVLLTVAGVETVQATPAHYTVSPDGGEAGTVTFVTAPANGARVTIICDEPVNQPLAVSTIQSFKSQGFQSGLDHLARIGRRAIDMATRSLRLRESDTPGSGAYDVGGNRLTNLAASSDPTDAARKSEITALAGSLAPVATSGAYTDLTGKPSLGTAAARNTGTATGEIPLLGSGGLPIVGGGNLTGMTKGQVGLANVDNTADVNKPISTLAQAALNLKANTSSLALVATSGAYGDLTGKPTLGTAAALNTGVASGNIPLLGASGLPAVGGSLLTGLTKGQVGLGSVDNTSDSAKPVSTATQTALNAKAPLNSPVLVTPTLSARPATSDNSALIPDTKWVNDAISGAVASGVADGDKGDIVVSGSGTIWALDAGAAAALKDRANHTGSQAISTVTGLQTALDGKASTAVATTSADGLMASGDKTKLNAIASGATANDTDANLKNRANHTGTQAVGTITGLGTAATLNTGTASGNIPLLGASGLPAIGGSLLTGLTKSQVGLGSVDNTADTAKPISIATQTALNDKASLTTEDQALSGGARVTTKSLGNLSGASITPDPGDRPIQTISNNGAGSILPGSNYGTYLLEVVNASGAGSITTTGWTIKGDSFDTTVGSKFLCSCLVTANMAVMSIVKVL